MSLRWAGFVLPLASVISVSAAKADAAHSSTVTLGMLAEEALRHNLQIDVEQARIEEARALYELASAQAFPRGSATALFGGPIPEAKTTRLNDISSITPATYEGDFDFGELGVTFRLNAELFAPIYTFGKISNAKEAASHLVTASQEKVRITAAEVLLNVHKAFWGYQLLRSFEESLSEGEETLVKILAKVDQLLEAESPQVTESDRLRIIHGLAVLRVRLVDARSSAALSLTALKMLIGRPQTADLRVERRIVEDIPKQIEPLDQFLETALTRRPELQAIYALVRAQEAWLRTQERAFLPTFFIGGILSYVVTTNADNQTNPFIYDRFNSFDVGLGLGLKWDLDVFTQLANRSAAEAQLGTRTAESILAAQAIELEIRKIHGEISSAFERIDHLESAYRAARGWQTASVLAYDVGTGDASELIDSFLARATAEAELRKTQFDVRLGLVDLDRAAGRLVGDVPP